MSDEIRIIGLDKLQKKLIGNADLGRVRNVVKAHGASLQRNAQRNAPVRTGNLRRSIGLDIEDGGFAAVVTARADYAAYVEYGTRYMPEKPFLRPAFEQEEDSFKKDITNLLRK